MSRMEHQDMPALTHTHSLTSVISYPINFFKYFQYSWSSKREVGTLGFSNKETAIVGGGGGQEVEETQGSDTEHHIHVRYRVHSFPI